MIPTRTAAVAGSLACVLALPAAAALPPVYQRVREIAAVAEAAALKLSAPIEAVRLVEPGRFEVKAGACSVEVRIVPYPPKIARGVPPAPGPLPFAAVAGAATCR